MKNVFTIVKKEFSRFFRDKRMILTVILPGIMIYVIYSLMGTVFANIGATPKDYKPKAYISGAPASMSETLGLVLEVEGGIADVDSAKALVEDGTIDVAVVFPADFEDNYGGVKVPDVEIYFNSAEQNSSFAYNLVASVLGAFTKPAFTINAGGGIYNLASEESSTKQIMSMMVPVLMFALLASACMAVAPESIAGEKERGTMATMLITPVNRSEIALGKILSLTFFALLGGISSFIGVILSLPKLMGSSINLGAVPYGVGEYFMLFGIIISVVLVIISAFSVLSTLAKSVKEAGALIGPMMMAVIVLGMVSIFAPSASVGLYAIPLAGSGLAMAAIMSMTASPLGVALAIISNLVVAALLVVLLAFMFNSEKIMFKK